MAEFFAVQAALFFAVAHVLIRRGLVGSNALTGSFVSLTLNAALLWVLIPFLVPLPIFWSPAIGYFIAAGVFAPGIGRTLSFVGIERVGVARSVPIVNSSPMFASVFAVIFLGETWALQNIIGTFLVFVGVMTLSTTGSAQGEWRKIDVIYPVLGALAFAISSILRKAGLVIANVPLMAAAVTATTGFLLSLGLLQYQGGWHAVQLSRSSFAWLFASGIVNTAAMVSVFYALSYGKVVIVEPIVSANPVLSILLTAVFLKDLEALSARVITGALITVVGTLLVVTVK
jgi:uncharacterized membrane protein